MSNDPKKTYVDLSKIKKGENQTKYPVHKSSKNLGTSCMESTNLIGRSMYELRIDTKSGNKKSSKKDNI